MDFCFTPPTVARNRRGCGRGGATIVLEPEDVPWGVQVVFEDLYGNSHVLLQPSHLALGQDQ